MFGRGLISMEFQCKHLILTLKERLLVINVPFGTLVNLLFSNFWIFSLRCESTDPLKKQYMFYIQVIDLNRD